jgi:spoIIIJ-associated protein
MNNAEIAKQLLTELFSFMGVKPQVDVTPGEDDLLDIKVKGDDLSFLIGYRGQSLDALQDLLSHMIFKKTSAWPSIILDINGYTDQRIDRLQNLAKRFIDRVRFFQTEVEMPYLNPWERRQVHTLVAEYDDVTSESRGEGKNRKLYLLPKKH